MMRLRGALSVLGVIAVVGAAVAGGLWVLRGPLLAAGSDVVRAAESLFVAGGVGLPLPGADAAIPAAVVDAATASPVGAVVARD
jgi:hypothetical protein